MARRRPCNRLCWQGVIGGPSNSSRQKLEALLSDFRWVTNPHHLEALLLQRPCRAELIPAIREGTTLVKTVVLAGPLGTISSPAIKSPISKLRPQASPQPTALPLSRRPRPIILPNYRFLYRYRWGSYSRVVHRYQNH